MAFDKFLIAPLNSGLMTNTKSWQIMDDAFDYLQNAYVFRGRLRKRFGSQLMGTSPLQSRLRINIGTTNAITGNLGATNLPGANPALAVGQIFSVGNVIFTVNVLGNVDTLSTDSTITGHINNGVNPNTFSITGNGLTNLGLVVYWYPSLPVMGIDQYEIGAINNHPTYAFDTQFAYLFSGGAWTRSGNALWKGNNTNYFWVNNWQSVAGTHAMFVTNFHVTNYTGAGTAQDDPIWYTLDGNTWVAMSQGANGIYFLPNGGAPQTGPFVETARIIVAFKDRLLLINTVENNGAGDGISTFGTNTQYKNRVRWCFNGSPLAVNAWYEPNQQDNVPNVAAGAGYLDATTEEAAVSAEFIKDRLIVYFERSTWELAYTGNEVLPFTWQKLNTELGSQSTFSTVPFDRDILTIGNTGVNGCNGSNVRRIDEKIPDEIFYFETKNNATLRTCGIRDYYTELVYWSYCSDLEQATQVFPNKVLVYNYANDSWAINDDCFTTFGYFEQQTDMTWESSAPITWERAQWAWNSNVIQANSRQILGGTPEGFILKLNVEENRNAPSMYITDMVFANDGTGKITLTIVNHNLDPMPTQVDYDGDFILIENVVGDPAVEAFLNGNIFKVDRTFPAASPNEIVIYSSLDEGDYQGGGTAARVSNVQIDTKAFNPYASKDNNVYVGKVDFAVQKTGQVNNGIVTGGGEITVDYYTSYASVSMISAGFATNSISGNNILETSPYNPTLYPLEQYSSLLWHPIYFQSSGEFIQLSMYFSLNQMLNPRIALCAFEMQGFCLYTQRVGRMQ
jgi:hypothetical protein